MTSLKHQNTIVLLIFLLLLSSLPVIPTTYASSSSSSSNHSISSKGCGEGYGYYMDDPDPICEPFDRIGKGPPPNTVFCTALGCPYNPPDLADEDEDMDNITSNSDQDLDLDGVNDDSTNDSSN